ncbi:putative chitosanase precursor [Ophiocordyceps camponoti-floridani]|uniref:Endo-chitosanase n=1 Tax=Ophiocordyceps camponoti-floridani TaxID=2030778 RepID=A0A8H4VBX5_9HYPO|nr:putative chitosanase precursor [Ophiocordyceps camponoti-floridani]
MDIDCDGDSTAPFNDTRCKSSLDTQSQTSFREELAPYGITDLNANIHTYVVFGNTGSKPGWPTFDPAAHGIKPLSVMAVVCGQRLVYGIWGDTNGDDGKKAMVGEASISLATACYGDSVDGDQGHDENDVLYLAFPGEAAVPGPDGAAWNASDPLEFERSLEPIGDMLVSGIGDVSSGRRARLPHAAGRLLVAAVTLAGLGV